MVNRYSKTDDLIKLYRAAAEGTSNPDPNEANKWYDQVHAIYKQLRRTAEGKDKITELISDPSPNIRMLAAAHSLMWAPDIARKALETLRDSNGPRSFEAKMTLKEFEKGTLMFDY